MKKVLLSVLLGSSLLLSLPSCKKCVTCSFPGTSQPDAEDCSTNKNIRDSYEQACEASGGVIK